MITSAQDVKLSGSVTTNSPQDYTHHDDHTLLTYKSYYS